MYKLYLNLKHRVFLIHLCVVCPCVNNDMLELNRSFCFIELNTYVSTGVFVTACITHTRVMVLDLKQTYPSLM